ncbi:MAG: capsid assembly protein [Sandaracinus sp.]|nr:capsid assembly protein [Sandaracinus sp.]|tara:strand:- start:1694 stop:3295 length:1602 start_codon:yes stop_codon:yes gene_type:complete
MRTSELIALVVAGVLTTSGALAQAPAGDEATEERAETTGPQPFGANLFDGNFAGQREDGINPDYRILPGDRVVVNAWGALTLNDVFGVDTQGNIFIPSVGPIHLEGVRNADLTSTVRGAIGRTYRGTFGVYTNLLNASPVAVFVTGGVDRPGRYAGIPSDSVLFFLAQAGGISPRRGSYRHIKIMRRGTELAELDLYDFLLRGTLPTPQLEDGDTILVGRRGPVVEVAGSEQGAVLVELADEQASGRVVLDIVAPTTRATEVTVRGVRGGQPTVRTVSADAFGDTGLRGGDVVTFREEGRSEQIVVRLEGEHRGPSELAVRRGTRLLDLLNWVHVDPSLAHTAAVHLRRPEVARQQRRTILDSLDRLERSAMLALSGTSGEAEIRVREAEMVRAFVDRARNVQPLGRVVTASAGRQLNVLLQDGDTIVIPTRTNVVRIGGEVQVAQAVMYRPDLSVRDYVQMAGGYSNRAETDAIILMRPDGAAILAPDDAPIQPGDEILVPPKIDHKVFQNAVDLSQIIYQIAVAASVLLRI